MRIVHGSVLLGVFGLACGVVAQASELAGHRFLITSIRTGDTEIFLVDPYWGDATNLTRCPQSQERPDFRPVYVMGADGSDPHIVEILRYHCAIDGSRAVWKPR
jgi:hypothetical protein